MEDKITLYPSNWLYNAGVVGLLKVLENIKDVKYEIKDGYIEIHKKELDVEKIFEKWDELTKIKLNIFYKGKERGTKDYYYANQTEKSIKEKIKSLLENDKKEGAKRGGFNIFCSICGASEIVNKTKLKEKKLTQAYGKILLASARTFPNSYWMLNPREIICSKCEFILMCHHIPFINLEGGNKNEKIEIFINSPSFTLIMDLNNFAENLLQKSKEYEIRKILGSSLLQWAIKRRALLGAWAMMNIEVIVKKRIFDPKTKKVETIIDYFDLPSDITKILLDYEIASLIERINEEKIFDLILRGKFSEIEKANYFVLKAILKLKNKEEISKNDPITKYFTKYQDFNYLKKVSEILPELYLKILGKIGR
jgi:CRISPR-associated protein Cst1